MGSIFAVFLGVGAIGGRLENGQITSQLNQNLSRFQIIFSQIIINLIFSNLELVIDSHDKNINNIKIIRS